ncbi:hypothetical protein [Nonomuraea jiangxiensis]|uniref:Uncharacterized protein n=1 Tax=Nonomuraea jiangxiensis TaxID=633440 RepID=A0A1G8FB95_9ACTN|nr:hypothetical protein [Nonomuraea jiangxiensis]SDH79249.1 hypothetical protein SAMN05421869_103262 [Nonomuraea jiangxiensis]
MAAGSNPAVTATTSVARGAMATATGEYADRDGNSHHAAEHAE